MASLNHHLMLSQTQHLDQSPTPTPYPTRACSPVNAHHQPHSEEDAHTTMEKLRSMIQRQEPILPVNVVDGSVTVSNLTKFKYLAIYFAFNLGLTLYNKALMSQFPYPFLLTALHAAFGCIGTHVLLVHGDFTLSRLTSKDVLMLSFFSILYTANIAISNMSLSLVTIPFHQAVRATTPVFIVAIYAIFFSSTYGSATYYTLVPVIAGVGFATYGDYQATLFGFLITLLGAVLAAIKTVATNRIQTTGLHLSAMEILYRMCPLALLQSLSMAYFNGETDAFLQYAFDSGKFGNQDITVLIVNGAMAFGLNLASFAANKKVGALAMTVAANVKQALAVVLAVVFWRLTVGIMNAFGIALTMFGGFWYTRVEMAEQLASVGTSASAAAAMEDGKAGQFHEYFEPDRNEGKVGMARWDFKVTDTEDDDQAGMAYWDFGATDLHMDTDEGEPE